MGTVTLLCFFLTDSQPLFSFSNPCSDLPQIQYSYLHTCIESEQIFGISCSYFQIIVKSDLLSYLTLLKQKRQLNMYFKLLLILQHNSCLGNFFVQTFL